MTKADIFEFYRRLQWTAVGLGVPEEGLDFVAVQDAGPEGGKSLFSHG